MSIKRICTDCVHNNNGWCNVKRTNKGLRELIVCDERVVEFEAKSEPRHFDKDINHDAIKEIKSTIETMETLQEVDYSEKIAERVIGLKLALHIINKH